MSSTAPSSADILQRMVDAVEAVRQRLLKASAALRGAGVPYAVVGGNAVAAWVATVDRAAVRNTQDVDVLLRRSDFDRAKAALEGAGFVHSRAAGIDLFLDDAGAKAREAVHVVFAQEVVRAGEPTASPDVAECVDMGSFRVLTLDAVVRLGLAQHRLTDRVDVRDLIDVGLVDQSWTTRLIPPLAARLQQLLDTPDG